MQTRSALYILLCATLFAGCDPDYVFVSVQSDPSLPPSSIGAQSSMTHGPEEHGRFIGVVRIGTVDYFGDALVTQDGQVRLYIGGPYSNAGSLQVTAHPSMQFVGSLDLRNGGTYGHGVVFSEACVATPICNHEVPAELNIGPIARVVRGELRLSRDDKDETWSMNLAQWDNDYARTAVTASMAGQYEELISPLSQKTRTLLRIDVNGRLSFQDIHTGCSGRGTLKPHSSGQFNVYDVDLHIESCDAPHAFLNGDLEGLAAESASSSSDYDSLLRIWLSTHAERGTLVGLTLLARRW